MVGCDIRTGQLLSDSTSCMMCRRMVINAGLETVIIQTAETEFVTLPVSDWVAKILPRSDGQRTEAAYT